MAKSNPGGRTQLLGAIGLGCAVLGPLSAYSGLVSPLAGFGVMALGLLLSIISLVTGIIALVTGGGGAAVRAMLPGLGVIGAIALVLTLGGGGGHPRINDITTDVEAPPRFVHAASIPANHGRDMSYPGADFATQQREGYGEIAPLALAEAPAEAFARVQKAAHAMAGWEITREDAEAGALEGTQSSGLFRFVDDFVIEVRAAESGSLVHMRSKSRDGQGDLGVNAARISTFFAALGG